MIAVFSALKEEVNSFKNRLSISKTHQAVDQVHYEGQYGNHEVLLVLTGIGKERAQHAVESVLAAYPVSILISTGFAGALNDKTKIGDVVVCSKLVCGEEPNPGAVFLSDPGLVNASLKPLEGIKFRSIIGNAVTVPLVCNKPEDKRAIGKRYEADAVDMESYWIAQIAVNRKLPFIAVRSIFDSVEDDLSPLTRLTSARKFRPLSAMAYLVSHPGKINKMTYFARNAVKAERNLAVFLDQLIKSI